MFTLKVLTALLTLSAADSGWEVAAQKSDLTIYTREKKDSGVHEMKAQGVIDAPPEKVWHAVRDYENYPKTMPYTTEGKIVEKQQGDKLIWFYSVIDAPFVAKRDYVIKLTDVSDWKDGKGFLKVEWTNASDKGPKPRDGYVRVPVNDGYWMLEPRENGTKTFATYYLYTDPGGSIPRWIVNKANGTAVPDVFRAVKKAASAK